MKLTAILSTAALVSAAAATPQGGYGIGRRDAYEKPGYEKPTWSKGISNTTTTSHVKPSHSTTHIKPPASTTHEKPPHRTTEKPIKPTHKPHHNATTTVFHTKFTTFCPVRIPHPCTSWLGTPIVSSCQCRGIGVEPRADSAMTGADHHLRQR